MPQDTRLLDSAGNEYPGVGAGFGERPKEIFVRACIYNVTSISLETQVVNADVDFELCWIDRSLTSTDVIDNTSSTAWELRLLDSNEPPRFSPRPIVANSTAGGSADESGGQQFAQTWYSFSPLAEDDSAQQQHSGRRRRAALAVDSARDPSALAAFVTLRLRGHLGLLQEFDLRSFPCDEQNIEIRLQSQWDAQCPRKLLAEYGSGSGSSSAAGVSSPKPQSVVLVKNLNPEAQSVLNKSSFVFKAEYRISKRLFFERGVTDPRMSMSRTSYPYLTTTFHVARKPQYFVYNLVLPSFLFVALSFASMLLPPADLHSRIDIVLAILLTEVAFKFLFTDKLPKTPYLSWLDKYMTATFFVVCSVGCESVLMNILYPDEYDSITKERYVAFVGLLLWCVVFFRLLLPPSFFDLHYNSLQPLFPLARPCLGTTPIIKGSAFTFCCRR